VRHLFMKNGFEEFLPVTLVLIPTLATGIRSNRAAFWKRFVTRGVSTGSGPIE
jgi:hypothetical protein